MAMLLLALNQTPLSLVIMLGDHVPMTTLIIMPGEPVIESEDIKQDHSVPEELEDTENHLLSWKLNFNSKLFLFPFQYLLATFLYINLHAAYFMLHNIRLIKCIILHGNTIKCKVDKQIQRSDFEL